MLQDRQVIRHRKRNINEDGKPATQKQNLRKQLQQERNIFLLETPKQVPQRAVRKNYEGTEENKFEDGGGVEPDGCEKITGQETFL